MNFRCPGRTFATRACHRMDNSRGRCSPMSKALRLRGTECRHRRFGFGEYHDPLWGDGPRRPVKKTFFPTKSASNCGTWDSYLRTATRSTTFSQRPTWSGINRSTGGDKPLSAWTRTPRSHSTNGAALWGDDVQVAVYDPGSHSQLQARSLEAFSAVSYVATVGTCQATPLV
jgi:hypothetical protein